jgi:hypothetical protein
MRLNSKFPRQLHNETIYVLTTKNNYFGIHLPYQRKDIDANATKTHLVSFTKREHAAHLREALHIHQRSKSGSIDQLIQNTEIYPKGAFRPLHIQKMKAFELERVCRSFWLDMLVIININPATDNSYDMDGFHYHTEELPAREILIPLLQERLYQSDAQ